MNSNEDVDPAIEWLTDRPATRWADALFLDHTWVSLLVILLCGVYFAASRFYFTPPLREEYPRLTWLADIVLGPTVIFLASALMQSALVRLGVPELARIGGAGMTLLAYILIAWLGGRGLELFVWQGYYVAKTGHDAPALVRGLSYGLLLLLVLLFVLAQSGYSPTGLLVSTGVFAAVLGLALQSTLSDFFSAIAISIEEPFQVGDWIELEDGTLGQVVDITWRSTRLLSFNNSIYVVPNSRMAAFRLHNFHKPSRVYAVWYEIQLAADLDPHFAKALLIEAATRCRYVLHEPAPVIRLADATTVPYRYMVWVHFASFVGQYVGRDALFAEIDAILKRAALKPSVTIQEIAMGRAEKTNAQPPTVAHALRSVDLFAPLTDAQIERLASMASYRVVEAESVLMQQGRPADAIYVVMSGLLKTTFKTSKGVEIGADELKSGDSFGQISLITAEPAMVTVTALTEASLVRLDHATVKMLLDEQPKLADAFARVVADRLQSVHRAQAAAATSRARRFPRSVSEIRARIERLFEEEEGPRRGPS